MKLKVRNWGCLVCKNSKNELSSSKCSICGTKKQKSRFGIYYRNSWYLCRANTSNLHNPSLNVLCCDGGVEFHHIIPLVIMSDHLDDCVVPSLDAYFKDEEEEDLSLDMKSVTSLRNHSGFLDPNSPETADVVGGGSESLFDQLIGKGRKEAYDSNIGRYIALENLDGEGRDMYDDPDGRRFKTTLTYVDSMEAAKKNLAKCVEDVQVMRRNEKESGIKTFRPPKPEDPRMDCGICQMNFPVVSLLGEIPFKSAVDWRGEHEAPIPVDIRFDPKRVYDSVRICLFCLQFFNKNFGEHLDEARMELKKENENKGGVIKMNTDSRGKLKMAPNPDVPTGPRPMSRMQLTLAMAHLRTKKETGERLGRYQMAHGKRASAVIDHNSVGTALRDKYKDLATVEHMRRQRELDAKLAEKAKASRTKSNPRDKSPDKGGVTFLTDSVSTITSVSASGPRKKSGNEAATTRLDVKPSTSPRKARRKRNKNKLRGSSSKATDGVASEIDVLKSKQELKQSVRQRRDLSTLVALEPVRKRVVSSRNVLPMLLVVREDKAPAVNKGTKAQSEGDENEKEESKGKENTDTTQTRQPRVIEAMSKLVSKEAAQEKIRIMRQSISIPKKVVQDREVDERETRPNRAQAYQPRLDQPQNMNMANIVPTIETDGDRPARPTGLGRGGRGRAPPSPAPPSPLLSKDSDQADLLARIAALEAENRILKKETGGSSSTYTHASLSVKSNPKFADKRGRSNSNDTSDFIPRESQTELQNRLGKIEQMSALWGGGSTTDKEDQYDASVPLPSKSGSAGYSLRPGKSRSRQRSGDGQRLSPLVVNGPQMALSPSATSAHKKTSPDNGTIPLSPSLLSISALFEQQRPMASSRASSRRDSFRFDDMFEETPLTPSSPERPSSQLRRSAGAAVSTHFFDTPFGDTDFVGVPLTNSKNAQDSRVGLSHSSSESQTGKKKKPRKVRSFDKKVN